MGLDPVASSPYRVSLGNLPSCMSVTWPSQRRRLLVSRAYILRVPALAGTSVLGIRFCQEMPRIPLRQHSAF